MARVLRIGAIVVLAVGMLNATTGLCLCRGTAPDPTSDQAGSQSCCHRNVLAVSAHGTACCHIEYVPHAATSTDVVVMMQPVVASTPVLVPDSRHNASLVVTETFTPSPPGDRILRI